MQKVIFCLLVADVELSAGLHLMQKEPSCSVLVVEISCFSEQKKLRMQNVTLEQTTTKLPGDCRLLGPSSNLEGWQT